MTLPGLQLLCRPSEDCPLFHLGHQGLLTFAVGIVSVRETANDSVVSQQQYPGMDQVK
jgi:hypothetical protein